MNIAGEPVTPVQFANVEYGDRAVSEDTMEELGDSGMAPLESGVIGRDRTDSPLTRFSVFTSSSKQSEPRQHR